MYNKPLEIDNPDKIVGSNVRTTSFIVPIIMITYGFIARFNIFDVPHIAANTALNNIDLYLISAVLLLIGIWQMFSRYTNQLAIIVRLFTYQVTLGFFLITITGIASPFILVWLFIMSGPDAYLQNRIFLLNILLFGLIITIDTFIMHSGGFDLISYGIVAFIIIAYTGWTIMQTQITNAVQKEEITTSKSKEVLQRDQFSTIINNLSDAVISTDIDGTIRVYNAASLNLLDTNASLNGRNIGEILPVTNAHHEPVNLFREIKKSKTIVKRDDLTHTFSDGEEMRLEVTYSPIRKDFQQATRSKDYDGYIVIARDITKSKSLAEERNEFISVISHELRTPITVAEGTISNVQMMLDKTNMTKKMFDEGIGLAHKQIISLGTIINDLSSLSRAERGVGREATVIDVTELANAMITKFTNEAKIKNIQLDLDLEPQVGRVNTSRTYLEELLDNLITNGIKYTKEGSVKLIFAKKGNKIQFAVKDTGIGIGKSDIDKVFDKFYRSEDFRTRETGGTGLGLYVAAKLAHQMGTKIDLTSRLNVGSTFSFELPQYKEKVD